MSTGSMQSGWTGGLPDLVNMAAANAHDMRLIRTLQSGVSHLPCARGKGCLNTGACAVPFRVRNMSGLKSRTSRRKE